MTANVEETNQEAVQENQAVEEQAPKQEVEKTQQEEQPKKKSKVELEAEEYQKITESLSQANKEAKERRLKLKEWDDIGKSPEEIKALLQAQQEAELKQLEEEKQYETLLEREREQRLKTEQEAQEKLKAYEERLRNKEKTRAISDLIAKEQADADILKYVLNERVDVQETEDGDYVAVALGDDGQPLEGGFEALAASLKEHKSWSKAFPAPKVNGIGTQSGGSDSSVEGGKRVPKTSKLELNTIAKKNAFIEKHGWDAYDNLPLTR